VGMIIAVITLVLRKRLGGTTRVIHRWSTKLARTTVPDPFQFPWRKRKPRPFEPGSLLQRS
jgi:hypothetical protein